MKLPIFLKQTRFEIKLEYLFIIPETLYFYNVSSKTYLTEFPKQCQAEFA